MAVKVYRWCDASWPEDQDFWRLSDIFYEVLLVSPAPVHIYDFRVRTLLDEACEDADLEVSVNSRDHQEFPVVINKKSLV